MAEVQNLARRVVRLALFVALANAPFWLLATHSFVSRGMVSLDSLLALVVFQYSATWGLVLIAVAWACDLCVTASFGYHFASPLDFVRSVGFADNIDWKSYLQLQPVAAVAPFAAVFFTLWRFRWSTVGPVPIVAAALLLVLVDAFNGSSAVSRRDMRQLPVNIAGSAIYGIARAYIDDDKASTLVTLSPGAGGVAEFKGFVPTATTSGPSIIYVIVESMGQHKSIDLGAWLQRQVFPPTLASLYTFSFGTIPAYGGTTAGELRRLCGLQGSYRMLTTQTGTPCLPNVYASAGWQTIGLHGFSSEMFDRRHWWPMIGIKDAQFAEQLRVGRPRVCGGAFRGICDADLLAAAVKAANSPRTFVYALTLNSHLPLAPIDIPQDLSKLCAQAATGPDVCALLAYQGLALRALADALETSPTKPFVLVAGDHSPPFFDSHSRAQFAPNSVPVYSLSPKAGPRETGAAPSLPRQTTFVAGATP